MMNQITRSGQRTIGYRARYIDTLQKEIVRTFRAVNDFQAQKIADGIAKINHWKIKTIGRM